MHSHSQMPHRVHGDRAGPRLCCPRGHTRAGPASSVAAASAPHVDLSRSRLLSKAALLSCNAYASRRRVGGSRGGRCVAIEQPSGKIAALVVRDPTYGVIVAFSGCRSVDELLCCANVGFVDVAPPSGMSLARLAVNAAIWHRYEAVRPQLLETLDEALGWQGGRVTFTGHSLGGAVAQLAAFTLDSELYLAERGLGCMSVSFGAPRVGDAGYASALRRQSDARGGEDVHVRVVLEHDIVPALRLHSRLVHAGSELRLPEEAPSTAAFPMDLLENHSSRRYLVAANRTLNLACDGGRVGFRTPRSS